MLRKQDGTLDFRFGSVNDSFLPVVFTDEVEATYAEMLLGHSLNIPVLSLCPSFIEIPVTSSKTFQWAKDIEVGKDN